MGLVVGDKLHASCSDEIFGTVVAVHEGEYADIENVSIFDVLDEHIDTDTIPRNIRVRLNSVKFRFHTGDGKCRNENSRLLSDWMVIFETPGDGCFRCTQLFSIVRNGVRLSDGVSRLEWK